MFVAAPLTSSTFIGYTINTKNNNEINIIEYTDSVKTQLINEVDTYINTIAPSSKLDGEIVVDKCCEYNVDIAFVLAQGQIESHFGTTGTARKTNSVFNVGAYDGYSASRQRSNGFGFSHPNESVEPYLILLTNNYLVNGKTINDLMVSYINYLGMRYASDTRYEYMLRSVYNKINSKTNINSLYNEYVNCLKS
jgi:flagellum-specific peptidoglycan hydrolase FlgJ